MINVHDETNWHIAFDEAVEFINDKINMTWIYKLNNILRRPSAEKTVSNTERINNT